MLKNGFFVEGVSEEPSSVLDEDSPVLDAELPALDVESSGWLSVATAPPPHHLRKKLAAWPSKPLHKKFVS